MAVGQGSLFGGLSYLAVGRETTYGTLVTATANLDFLSSSMRLTKETKVLEEVERSRTYSKSISTGVVIEGDVEFYAKPRVDAFGFILQNAFGGTVTSATATGETSGAGSNSAITHTFSVGNMDQTYKSLSINTRKGESGSGKVFEFNGVRVNELAFSAELDEAVKCTASFIGKDVTNTSNDYESSMTVSSASPLSFVAGRVSVETSFSSLTSSSFWHVQSVELTMSNSLKSDDEARRIGSDTLDVLPPGILTPALTITMRFDTVTAWSAMKAATTLAVELEFLGDTLSGSSIREGLKIQMPKCKIADAGDPEIGGPDEILSSEVTFTVLRDDSSAAGYAIRALLTNQKANYT